LIVPNITVIVLFSGNGCIGNVSTLFVPAGDTSLTIVTPFGSLITTVILSTFVFVLGTETDTKIGVIPGANGIITEGLISLKLTPGEPGLI
jgi:hypothetical protein